MLPLFAFVAASALFAQGVKVVLESAQDGRFAGRAFFLPGGMPSSHSSAVTTLTCIVMKVDGMGSTTAAIACTLLGYMLYGKRRPPFPLPAPSPTTPN